MFDKDREQEWPNDLKNTSTLRNEAIARRFKIETT